MDNSLPVFAVCGWSGAGKTTLIEQMLPLLVQRGLKVAVVKRDVHGISVDRAGKDSDRFFNAGADVLLEGPGEGFVRTHGDGQPWQIRLLARQYDIVLVEGHKGTAFTKVWLLSDGDRAAPPEVDALAVLERDSRRIEAVMPLLDAFLASRCLDTPLYGCVLIGGASSRMGRAKHLLTQGGETWIERTTALLAGLCDKTVIAGGGEVPGGIACSARLSDVPGVEGPMAGVLAAMRWAPHAAWLVAACDMPCISRDAARWLLEQRRPGAWAVMPRLAGKDRVEPLFACYDFRAANLVESLAAAGGRRLSAIAPLREVITPSPPPGLESAWRNVNTVDELDELRRGPGVEGDTCFWPRRRNSL